MKYTRLEIPELILCEPLIHSDDRGFVYEAFKKESFNNYVGFDIDFCQDNILYNKYGVLRGLHTNTLNHAQSKLVSVLSGTILDVAVDFRIGSPTFGKYVSVELSRENKKQLFVPKGFLHGFSVLSEDALVLIKIDKYLAPGESVGIRYDDEYLDINWGIPKDKIILSSADQNLNKFDKKMSPFTYGINC